MLELTADLGYEAVGGLTGEAVELREGRRGEQVPVAGDAVEPIDRDTLLRAIDGRDFDLDTVAHCVGKPDLEVARVDGSGVADPRVNRFFLPAHRLIVPQPAFPHEMGGRPR